MTEVRPLAESDRLAWDALALASPGGGFMQSWAWSQFKRLEGYDTLRLGLFSGEKLLGGLIAYHFPSPSGPGLVAVPDGPIVEWSRPDADGQLAALITALRAWPCSTRAVAVRVEPRLARCPQALASWTRAPVDLVPEETLEVLLGREAEMLARMKPKGRYNARLSQRRGVEVELTAAPGSIHDFYFVLERTALYQEFLVEPKSFFINLLCSLPESSRQFAFARYKGMTLAAALIVRFGETATYLYGGHLPLFGEVMASEAMHWAVMRDAAARGCRLYDLYGYAGPDRPSHPYARFSRFKEKFGGTPVRRMGSRDLILYDRLADSALGLLRRAR